MTPIKHLLNAEGKEGVDVTGNSMNQSPLCSDDELSGGVQSPRRENSSISSGSAGETSVRNQSPGCTSDTSQDTENDETQMLICQWNSCGVSFAQPELLYHHLCKDHVGRKAQRNLQLNCHWGSCTTTTMKRDHITSHLRVHVPLKPFSCSTCNRKFKRPQDLKKHLRVHMHDAVKNKRGPKLGSKRLKKATYGNANDLKTSAALPSLTLERFVREEIDNYYPCYSQSTYDSSTRILLPPPKSHSMVSTERMHTSEIGTAMLYFSTLSKNMMRQIPDMHTKQDTQGTQSGMLPLPHPQMSFSASRNYAGGHTLPPLTSCVYGGMGGDSLPRLHNGRGSSSLATPQLPSLNSFPQTQWPHTRHHIFSLNQKASMDSNDEEDELVASLASLSVRRSDNVCSELQIINIIKDYLLCMLMEEGFPDASLEDNINPIFTPDVQQSALKRYPQVKV